MSEIKEGNLAEIKDLSVSFMTAAVHLQHPYGIFLAVVQGRYAQPF